LVVPYSLRKKEIYMTRLSVLSGIFCGKKVMIKVENPDEFIEAPMDQIGWVHYIDHSKGIVEPLLARRGDIVDIRIEG